VLVVVMPSIADGMAWLWCEGIGVIVVVVVVVVIVAAAL